MTDIEHNKARHYEVLLRAQQGGCAICGCKPGGKKLAMDHCHNSECVRGLLCYRCNMMLGSAEDCVEILLAAIEYLKQTTPPRTLKENIVFSRMHQRVRETEQLRRLL